MSTAHCQECGYRVSVDFVRFWLAASPTLLLIIAITTDTMQSVAAAIILLPLCLALTLLIDAVWVPLVPDQYAGPEMVKAGKARIAAERAAKAKQAQE